MTQSAKTYIVPMDISRTSDDQLTIAWTSGLVQNIPVRELRLKCPCATCVDEFTGQPLLDPKTVPADVIPNRVRSVGRYALTIEWSDGHHTGIFSFDYLLKMNHK